MKRKKKETTSKKKKQIKNKKRTRQNDLYGKTLLVVHTGSIKKKFIFQKLKKLGLRVIVLHKKKDWAQPYVDDWILVETTNYKESLEAVKSYLTQNPETKIDGVITFWEESVLLTARLSERFNWVGIPYNIAKKARNKFLFREFCERNKIRAPRHKLIRKKDDILTIDEYLDFPMVIKPIYGSSSAFVIKLENKQELVDSYEYIKKNISSYIDAAEWDELEVLVEEYIDGDEVDIDLLLQNGKIKFSTISDNFNKTKESFFIDSGQAIPSSLPNRDQEDLLALAEEVLEKLGIQNGCMHFEAKTTKDGVYPIEVNLRMGGDYVHSYIKAAWNVDLIEYAVKIALGIYIKHIKSEHPRKYIIGWDLHADYSGMLVELDLHKKLKNKRNLQEIHIHKQIGDAILVPPEGYEYLGWLTVSGDNMLDAQDNLTDILSLIQYKIVKFHSDSSMGKTLRRSRFSSAVLNKDILLKAAKIAHIKRASKKNLKNLHIGILGDNIESPVGLNGNGRKKHSLSLEKEIEIELRKRGYEKITIFTLGNFEKTFAQIKNSDVDVILNLFQKTEVSSLLEAHIAAMLDMLQVPYTGSALFALATGVDKIKAKKILQFHDIPTPRWDYSYALDDEIDESLEYPLIVKPANKDFSIGITQESVVTNRKELQVQLKKTINQLKSPALIEEYISGDEYDVSIIGNDEERDLRVLPLARTIFNTSGRRPKWNIIDYKSKWAVHSSKHFYTQQPPKNISKRLESLITEIALDAYNILECFDYGRVEIKIDENNNPYVLEINPNPQINKAETLFKAATLVGMDYGDFIEEIISVAINRYKNQSVTYGLQSRSFQFRSI